MTEYRKPGLYALIGGAAVLGYVAACIQQSDPNRALFRPSSSRTQSPSVFPFHLDPARFGGSWRLRIRMS